MNALIRLWLASASAQQQESYPGLSAGPTDRPGQGAGADEATVLLAAGQCKWLRSCAQPLLHLTDLPAAVVASALLSLVT